MAAVSSRRARHPLPSIWHLLRAVVVLAALGTASAWAVTLPSDRALSSRLQPGTVKLFTDDGNEAMFELTNLAPGAVEARCITVSYRGSARATIHMATRTSGASLLDELHTTIEVGTGGRFGNCRGFGGRPLFKGTFAELASAGDAGVRAFTTSDETERTFRLTVSLDENADVGMSQAADATFMWRADIAGADSHGGDDADEPPPSASALPPAQHAGGPAARGVRNAVGSEGPSPLASVGAAGSARRTSDAPHSGPRQPRESNSTRRGGAPRAGRSARAQSSQGHQARRRAASGSPVSRVLAAVARLVPPVLERSAFPLMLAILVAFFLVIQDRIDRRDPKLARAPLRPDPDLEFRRGGDA